MMMVYLTFKKIMCHVIKQSQQIDGKKKIMSWFFPGLPKVRISILLKIYDKIWKEDLDWIIINQKNKIELFNILKEKWFNTNSERINKLIDSMPWRVDTVLKNKGNPTRH